MKESPFCSCYRGHNRCGSCLGNKLGRTEQERDCRVNPRGNTVVCSPLLQRRQTASTALCANMCETSSPSTITVGRGKKSHFDKHGQAKYFFRCVGSFGA